MLIASPAAFACAAGVAASAFAQSTPAGDPIPIAGVLAGPGQCRAEKRHDHGRRDHEGPAQMTPMKMTELVRDIVEGRRR